MECRSRPGALLVAESDLNDPRLLHSREAGGYGLDAQWSDDFHHAVHTTLTREHDGYYEDFDGFDDLVLAPAGGLGLPWSAFAPSRATPWT